HPPRTQVAVDALELEGARVLDDEASSCQPIRRRPHENLPRPRGLLEPCGDVHRLAGGKGGLRSVDDDLAGLDADAGLELELVHCCTHCECSTRRAERIVLVCLRHGESGHHGITGELLDDATVLDDAARDRLEEPRDTATHDL